MKKCPFCAEEIKDEAIVCRYCGRDLTSKPTMNVQLKGKWLDLSKSYKKNDEPWYIALIIVIGSILLLLLIVFIYGNYFA